jgi:hypothetical protein
MADDATIPTEQELRALPRWALVAFAARCARRVQPLFKDGWPDAPVEDVQALERVIVLAEQSAASASVVPAGEAFAAAEGASAAYAAVDTFAANTKNAINPANAARFAAAAVAYTTARGTATPRATEYDAADAAVVASRAASAYGAYIDPVAHGPVNAATLAMRYDLELLTETAKNEKWDDRTPVPPEFFGPVWPFRVPEKWPEEDASASEGTPTLRLEFDIPDDINSEQADQAIRELVQQANELHLAMGGSGLIIREGRAYEIAPMSEPEPQGVR